jgi:hypothetical protein
MDDVVFRTRTKATYREGDRVRSSFNWMFARRGELALGPDRLTCGDWSLPYAEFERAAVVTVRAELGPGLTLMVWHGGRVYQFSLPSASSWRFVPHPFWAGELPFPVTRETRTTDPPSRWLMAAGAAAVAAGLIVPWLMR